jgi:hypothetical protein
VLYAPQPGEVNGLTGDVHRIRAGLRAGAGRVARIRAVIAPRSALRVWWGLSRHRIAASDRLKGRLAGFDRWTGALRRASQQQG